MGTSESKFKDAVRTGDKEKACDIFYSKKLLRDSLNPGETCYEDGSSVLHQAARHGIQPLYEELLASASPLKQNSQERNCLHMICSSSDEQDIRQNMLLFTLQNKFTLSKGSRVVVCTSDKVR